MGERQISMVPLASVTQCLLQNHCGCSNYIPPFLPSSTPLPHWNGYIISLANRIIDRLIKKKKIIILTWTQNQQRITRTEVKGEDRGKRCLSGNLMDLWLTAPSHVLASRKASGCKNRITSKVMEVKVSLKQEKWEFGIKNKITHKKFIPCTSEFNN